MSKVKATEQPTARKWYDIRARANQSTGAQAAEIFVYGDIGDSWLDESVTAAQFVQDINALDAAEITVRINSFGGSVPDGLAIHNAIRRHPARVTCAVDGVALSIASLIAMAGDEVHMAENATMMIHAPWGGVVGNSAKLREHADVLDKMAEAMATSYATASGKSEADVLALLTDGKDHWYTAREAMAEGFATDITPALAIAASANEFATPAFWSARAQASAKQAAPVGQPPAAQPAVETPAAAAAQTVSKGHDMTEQSKQAAASPTADPAAIRAEILAAMQANNKELIETGRAYAKFGGEALAMQAVAEGWSQDQLNAKLLAAASAGPAHAAYGQGARSEDNLDKKTHGFKSMGEFAFHVKNAALNSGRPDERLIRAAATTYGSEGAGADGGFAVPPQFAAEITRPLLEEESLLALADTTPVSGNSLTYPKDETTPWGSTGVYAAWESEAATLSQRKPSIGQSQLRLKKLAVLVGATEELLADSTAMAAYLTSKMREAVGWKINDAIINGTGAGMPLGILNGGSVVSVAKETSQAADSIVAANVAKQYARVLMGGGPLVWLMNPDAFPQIITLSLNSNPIWVPANQGFQGSPNGLLLGRPIIMTDACDTVGDVGDLILANMGGYRAITKAGGEEFATSMHLWFDQQVEAMRLTFRMDGQPVLGAAITPPNSSVTRSHFATIAARA